MAPQNVFLIGCMTAVEHYIFHCELPLAYAHFRLLVRKNGRLRYTARRNVGNRIMVFSTALWQKCWIP
ncbi:hypothetical protein EMCRGX_G013058 [Ephydatia muelleri]